MKNARGKKSSLRCLLAVRWIAVPCFEFLWPSSDSESGKDFSGWLISPKTAAKHATSEVCLLSRPSYSRGRACKVQSQHKHFMKKLFSKSVCNTVANIPEARAKGFFDKELLSPHSSLHIPNIHHPHLLYPLFIYIHHLHLLYNFLHHLL